MHFLVAPRGMKFVETETPIDVEPMSRHCTPWAARRSADWFNSGRLVGSYTYRPVKVGRLKWHVLAFQNLLTPE